MTGSYEDLRLIAAQDWKEMSAEQRLAVLDWNKRIMPLIRRYADTFEHQHPEVHLLCCLNPMPVLRARHPELMPLAEPQATRDDEAVKIIHLAANGHAPLHTANQAREWLKKWEQEG